MATPSKSALVPRNRSTRYPVEEWADGRTWTLKRGVDFTTNVNTARSVVADAGRRAGIRFTTSVRDDDTLQIQAVAP